MFKWLQRLFQVKQPVAAPPPAPAPEPDPAPGSAPDPIPPVIPTSATSTPPEPGLASVNSQEQAQAYLERMRNKISALAERFASGNLNRAQFQELYEYYQKEMQAVESYVALDRNSDDWKKAVNEGQSILIRRRNKAMILGFSIYENASGMPIKSGGQFALDPALFVPMLSAYRSAAEEIFGAQLRSTQIEGGQWLCFVPAKVTTTLAIFNLEPSGMQLKKLEELQQLFENANAGRLTQSPIDPDSLVCPQDYYIDRPL